MLKRIHISVVGIKPIQQGVVAQKDFKINLVVSFKIHTFAYQLKTTKTMASLKFKKTYKQGGGDYTTIVNGKEVNIMKQYRSNTWIAQTSCGEIDIERDKLESIRYMLEQMV
jgi:hypothetical protein